MKLTMIPEMTSEEIRNRLAGCSDEETPRFVLVCDGSDWCFFKARYNIGLGIELPVSFWEHDESEGGTGALFHYLGNELVVYKTDIRAIFDDEQKAIEVSKKLSQASRKFEERIKEPFVAYQMDVLLALA